MNWSPDHAQQNTAAAMDAFAETGSLSIALSKASALLDAAGSDIYPLHNDLLPADLFLAKGTDGNDVVHVTANEFGTVTAAAFVDSGEGDDKIFASDGCLFFSGGTGNDSVLVFGGAEELASIADISFMQALASQEDSAVFAVGNRLFLAANGVEHFVFREGQYDLVSGSLVFAETNAGTNDAAVPDFNGDSNSDILWQNDSGQAAVWLMNGTSLVDGGVVGPNPGADWHVQGAGQFNGDSNSDILWQNDSGQAAVWLMDGTNLIGGGPVGGNPGADWDLIA